MTRLLVAGTGLIGARHLHFIEADPALTLAGVVDPAPKAAADAPVFADLAAVDVPADGIVVATPTATHAALTIAALERGLHVLVEKPVADGLEAADRMIAAAAAHGRHVLVGHHRRHHPALARLREIVRGGAIGTPVAASVLWLMGKPDDYFDAPWRRGLDGGPVRQNLIHDVDMLRWLLGDVTAVAGLASNAVRGTARPESGGVALRFAGGAVATILYSDAAPSPWGWERAMGEAAPAIPYTGEDFLRVAGTAGSVEFPSLRVWSGAATWHDRPVPAREPVPAGEPLARQLAHFADVVAGRADPLCDAAAGRANLDVVLRVEAS